MVLTSCQCLKEILSLGEFNNVLIFQWKYGIIGELGKTPARLFPVKNTHRWFKSYINAKIWPTMRITLMNVPVIANTLGQCHFKYD